MIELDKHYRTRDGKYRTDNDTLKIVFVGSGFPFPVVAAVNDFGAWSPTLYTIDGRYAGKGIEHASDLIEIKPSRKGVVWVNCYRENSLCLFGHPTRRAADLAADEIRTACVRVEFEYEEGEGL